MFAGLFNCINDINCMEKAVEILSKGSNFIVFLIFVALVIAAVIALAIYLVRRGAVGINTGKIYVGSDQREREIIRQQIEYAHLFIMSLAGKIKVSESRYGGYFTKYVLERVYDEVVDWITFNHMSKEGAYISIKQTKVSNIVYSENVGEEFKTPEFKERMDKWTEELVSGLVQIRQVYK